MSKIKYVINSKLKSYGEGASVELFNEENALAVSKFHTRFSEYKKTPLISLPNLAEKFSLGSIYVKDESARFGLNAFKVWR